MEVTQPDKVSALCVDCGLCCSGVLFDKATIGPEEVDFARSIGMTAWTDHDAEGEKGRFALPCHYLNGSACGRYGEARPSVCAGFFCELALRLDRDEVTSDSAMVAVSQTRALADRLRPLIPPGESLNSLRQQAQGLSAAPADPAAAQRLFLLGALNRLLERHFLPPPKDKPGKN